MKYKSICQLCKELFPNTKHHHNTHWFNSHDFVSTNATKGSWKQLRQLINIKCQLHPSLQRISTVLIISFKLKNFSWKSTLCTTYYVEWTSIERRSDKWERGRGRESTASTSFSRSAFCPAPIPTLPTQRNWDLGVVQQFDNCQVAPWSTSKMGNNVQQWVTMGIDGQKLTALDNNPLFYMHLWCRFS